MCTSITAWRHAGIQERGAFVILTRPEGTREAGGGGGREEVRIRGVRPSETGVKIRVSEQSGRWGRGGFKISRSLCGFKGIRLHGSSRAAKENLTCSFMSLCVITRGLGEQGLWG